MTSHFKLVLLGNCGVGKSCIVLRFVRGEWTDAHDTTVGAAFQTKVLSLPGSVEPVKVELWDTAGQERYREEDGRRRPRLNFARRRCLTQPAAAAPRRAAPLRRLAGAHVLPRRAGGRGRFRRDVARVV